MTKELDLLLVNPGSRRQVYGSLASSLSGIEPPLWCGLIAAFIRERGYSVKIIDAEAKNWSPEYTAEKIAEYNPLLAGIIVLGSNPSASSTPKMTFTHEILNVLKRKAPYIKTIMGGLHPSALPERTLKEEDVDFICQGEGFYTILQLLKVLKSGNDKGEYEIEGLWYMKDNKVISNGWGKLVQNLDELPFVAWDLLPMEKYRAHNWHCFDHIDRRKPYAVIYTSLGCPFNCTYCNIRSMYNGQPGIRFRSPKRAVEEIDFLVQNYKVKNIKILDEMFVLRENHVMEFCDLIIQRGYKLNIWVYSRVDTINRNISNKMKQAGINWICFGFESASKKVRKGVSKRFRQDKIKKVVEMTKASGIYIIGNFIFGLPDDDLETMQETLNMAKEFNFEYVNFYTTMAYPGSQLYEDALQKGVKLPDTWHGYSQYSEDTLPLPTKHLSSAEVLRFRDNAFKEYYKNPKYIKMIKEKFGAKVVEHIEEMLKHEIHRKFI
ncbi:Anaerobic magnesium-protoporphyrin IX monomethyl ester cyclase [subsurface metagenome]